MTWLLDAEVDAGYGGKPGALRGVPLRIGRGEIVALIGQSGSGKSTLGLVVTGLLRFRGGQASGRVMFEGEDLLAASERRMREIRGKRIGLVFQSAATALNPSLTIEAHLKEAWRAHRPGSPDYGALLAEVRLPGDAAFLRRYPRQLSLGQAQRVLIALGVVHRPALLVADEPTSALDVITQAEILDLFARLNRSLGMSILLITHDLLSVANLAHRAVILNGGRVVEEGPVSEVFAGPREEYTKQLIGALPRYPEEIQPGLRSLHERLGAEALQAGSQDADMSQQGTEVHSRD